MRCDTVRTDLLEYLNSETGTVRAWVIRRHLAACAGCAQELTALRQFTTMLRRADLVPPLDAPVAVPARRLPLRRAVAAMAAVLLVVGLLLLPTLHQRRQDTRNPGAAVAAALARVNTWHFAGWKLIDGQQVPWEVWGRRSPWLYYERVGDTTTWSDGKQRLRVFAPNPALKRPEGLIIKTSVDQVNGDAGFLSDPAYQRLVNDQRTQAGFGDGDTKLYAQTSTVARFRSQHFTGMGDVNENKLYVVSKRDWLPTTYHLHFDNAHFARDTEYLTVRYDVDLPDGVVAPPYPGGYSFVDFTRPAAGSRGFRVQVQPVGMDKEGSVLVVGRGWLGRDRLLEGSTFSLDLSPFVDTVSGQYRGRSVKYLYASGSSGSPGGDVFLPYAPVEPSEVRGSLPDTFRLSLAASPQILVRSSDQFDALGRTHPGTTTERLFTETLRFTLPLPREPVGSVAAFIPPSVWHSLDLAGGMLPLGMHPSPQFELEYGLAARRSSYYLMGYDYRYTALKQVAPRLVQAGAMNPDGTVGVVSADGIVHVNETTVNAVEAITKRHQAIFDAAERKFRARGAYWQERKVEMLPVGGATQQERFQALSRRILEMETLAEFYQKAGDRTGRDRTLRQIVLLSGPFPALAGSKKAAESSLRKGPS